MTCLFIRLVSNWKHLIHLRIGVWVCSVQERGVDSMVGLRPTKKLAAVDERVCTKICGGSRADGRGKSCSRAINFPTQNSRFPNSGSSIKQNDASAFFAQRPGPPSGTVIRKEEGDNTCSINIETQLMKDWLKCLSRTREYGDERRVEYSNCTRTFNYIPHLRGPRRLGGEANCLWRSR